MTNILEKVFPAKRGLAERFDALHQKVDHGGLSPAKADLEMADILCREMTDALGDAAPRFFSVWLAGKAPSEVHLAGWSCREEEECGPPPPRLPASLPEALRVLGTRRPLILKTEEKARALAERLFPGKEIPRQWSTAALVPLEKAGEALGLGLAFFHRPLTEADVEGMIRFCDLLGSSLFTGEDGLAEIPVT